MPKQKTQLASPETPDITADPRFKMVERTLKRVDYRQDALIEVLHTAQENFGFLSDELLVHVAHELKLPPSWVYGVATFYHFFSLKPQGEHSCIVCLGTACYVKQSSEIIALLENAYGIKPGQTTPDGKLSLATARCLGSCGLAPMLIMDGDVWGREAPEVFVERIKALVGTLEEVPA